MDRVHYNITGLVNESAKTQMKNSLEKVDGVSNVCVDLGRSSVEVMFNKPATCDTIKSCIESTGHNILNN